MTTRPKHPRKLANYIVADVGQLSFLAINAAVSTILVALSILTVWPLATEALDGAPVEVVSAEDVSASTAKPTAESEPSRDPSWLPVASIALLHFAAMFGAGIFISHRVFGPIGRLRAHVIALTRGEEAPRIALRGHDSFKALAAALNELAAVIEAKERR